MEAVRVRTAPSALLTMGVDSFFALASVVADELYGRPIPLISLTPDDFAKIKTGDWIVIDEDGSVTCRNDK